MKARFFLRVLALAVAAPGCSSCDLMLEGAITSNLESRALAPGSRIDSKSFSVTVPHDTRLYLRHFDKKREYLELADTDPVTLGYEYFVFPADAASGESPGTALLRHYTTRNPRGNWEAMATRPGGVKGSIGQVDIRSRRKEGGFVLSSEAFRDGTRIWMVSNLLYYPGPLIDGTPADVEEGAKLRAREARKKATAFAKSFRLKR
ncbi:hypothetical protein [Luteolibacter sp. Populi]|uniref:hypothetical protein n=1 Tax=Luteolibacter sp. Populi TaxID=3230487 RepID=UPI003465845F